MNGLKSEKLRAVSGRQESGFHKSEERRAAPGLGTQDHAVRTLPPSFLNKRRTGRALGIRTAAHVTEATQPAALREEAAQFCPSRLSFVTTGWLHRILLAMGRSKEKKHPSDSLMITSPLDLLPEHTSNVWLSTGSHRIFDA